MTMVESLYESFQTLVRDTTINNVTLLSTDYLNHFNEAVMLLEMVPEIPEMIDDVKEWQPKSYEEHFLDSQFKARDLAIEAFDVSPRIYREPFDKIIAELNESIASSLPQIESTLNEQSQLTSLVKDVTGKLRNLIDRAGAIINGSTERVDQSAVDALFEDAPGGDTETATQDAVDALFAAEQGGDAETVDQSAIDAMFDNTSADDTESATQDAGDPETIDQSAIDALFDEPADISVAVDAGDPEPETLWARFAPSRENDIDVPVEVAIAFSREVALALGAAPR